MLAPNLCSKMCSNTCSKIFTSQITTRKIETILEQVLEQVLEHVLTGMIKRNLFHVHLGLNDKIPFNRLAAPADTDASSAGSFRGGTYPCKSFSGNAKVSDAPWSCHKANIQRHPMYPSGAESHASFLSIGRNQTRHGRRQKVLCAELFRGARSSLTSVAVVGHPSVLSSPFTASEIQIKRLWPSRRSAAELCFLEPKIL